MTGGEEHTKDIHEVEGIQPSTFNRIHCGGVAAKAGNVYPMGRKGGASTHP